MAGRGLATPLGEGVIPLELVDNARSTGEDPVGLFNIFLVGDLFRKSTGEQ